MWIFIVTTAWHIAIIQANLLNDSFAEEWVAEGFDLVHTVRMKKGRRL